LNPLVITPLEGLPLVKLGDDLGELILATFGRQQIELLKGDVIVVAQKIVSKAEGRTVRLADVEVSERAKELAATTQKDPRVVQLILDESNEILRARPNLLIVEHKLGFICANAGIDHSNIEDGEGSALLLPVNPDASADAVRAKLEAGSAARIGVLIIDSHGRAWREGTEGVTIGMSGIPGVVDLRGRADLSGRTMQVTTVGAADELAAAASLVMGQSSEGIPAVHVRGFPYPLREGRLAELLRPKERDAFR
jgi:coenzyme F420-0:L-glutamate ligase / coenzyme F420-1:gamma-L-glutamate ligase